MNIIPSHIGLVAVGGANWMGGSNYVRNLAEAIRVAAPATKITYIVGEPLAKDWTDVAPQIVVAPKPSLFQALMSGKRSMASAVKNTGIEFAYPFTYDNEYNLGLNAPLRPHLGAAGWAGWVPDFQHRHLPELFSKEELRRRDDLIGSLVAEAPRVVLSSESAAADFASFYPEHKGKAQVLRFAVPPPLLDDDDAPATSGEPERFFLVCNQFWKHKNHLVVFEALRLLCDRGTKPVVLCTGQLSDYRDNAYANVIRKAISDGGLSDQVRLLGLLPRHEQLRLMRRAIAVIQPSLFEGWSTVVEDARVLGRPTLLSDIAVHREQNPPGARFFPATSAEELATLMAEAWKWPAGPDDAGEDVARAQAQTRLVMVGRRFLEIASSAR